jgi:hypothetical protein
MEQELTSVAELRSSREAESRTIRKLSESRATRICVVDGRDENDWVLHNCSSAVMM